MSDHTGDLREFPVRGAVKARAEQYLDAVRDGTAGPPPEPRRASTVLLVNPPRAEAPAEVFMQLRVAAMAFAPGVSVFPGGGVDPRDDDPRLPMSGPPLSWWSRRLGCEEGEARALLSAACREVFEECGVLLANREGHDSSASDVAGLLGGAEKARLAREALSTGGASLADVLLDSGLEMRTESLTPFARWITPEYQPRRYDTVFFLAMLPEGQQADGESTETEKADWVRPADVLGEYQAGRVSLMTPTVVALEQFAHLRESAAHDEPGGLDDLFGREWSMRPVLPYLVQAPDGSPTLLFEVP